MHQQMRARVATQHAAHAPRTSTRVRRQLKSGKEPLQFYWSIAAVKFYSGLSQSLPSVSLHGASHTVCRGTYARRCKSSFYCSLKCHKVSALWFLNALAPCQKECPPVKVLRLLLAQAPQGERAVVFNCAGTNKQKKMPAGASPPSTARPSATR